MWRSEWFLEPLMRTTVRLLHSGRRERLESVICISITLKCLDRVLTATLSLWSPGSEAKYAVNIVCLNKWGRLEGLVKDDEVRTASCLHIASPRISSVRDVNKEMSIRRQAQSILERGKREKWKDEWGKRKCTWGRDRQGVYPGRLRVCNELLQISIHRGGKKNPGKMILCLVIVKRCRTLGGGGKWAESVCGGWGVC